MLQRGILYSESAGHIGHRQLSLVAYDLQRRDDYTRMLGIRSSKDFEKYQRCIISNVRSEISSLAKTYKINTLFFSSEHFQSRLTTLDELERLKSIIYDLGASTISIIVYLRNPASIASSLYSTALRAGHCIDCPPPPSNKYFFNVCNHASTLEKFGSVFGESSLIPRIFSSSELVNGSIIDDFMQVTGTKDDECDYPVRTNEGLSIVGVELLRRLNESIPSFVNGEPNPLRADLINYIEKLPGPKYQMPTALREEYDSCFSSSNQIVRERYFPHRASLFLDQCVPAGPTTSPDVDIEAIANFVSNIWNDKQLQIHNNTRLNTSKWYSRFASKMQFLKLFLSSFLSR